MAKKTDPAFRERMLKRRQETARKGVVIDKKTWRKGRIRLLPSHGKDPATEYNSVYCKELRKGCTAPRTFGVVDPLWVYLEDVYKHGDKAQKQHAKDSVTRSTEYWAGCIIRGDEGTAESPNVHVFRLPYTVYEYIIGVITDEDFGEDITDAKEGRDLLLRKEGEGVNTKWKPDKMDCEPIVEDKALRSKLVGISKTFDPSNHFFSFDLEDYTAIYEIVTGEEIPEDALEALQELDENGPPDTGDSEEEEYDEEEDEGDGDEEEEEYDDEGEEGDDEEEEEEYDDDEDEEGDDEDEESEEASDEAPDGIEFGSTRVTFEAEDGETEGTVMGWAEDGENLNVVEDDADPDDPWEVDPSEITILEEDEEPEPDEEEEAEEAEPTVTKAKKKTPRRPASSKAGSAIRKPATSKKKTTTRKKPATSKKKTTKKTGTRKKTSTRKPSASKKKTSKKKTSRRGGGR